MGRILSIALAGSIAALVAGAASAPASARIRCNGPYQVIRGQGEITTPYCEDNYLARIAHRYGFRGSARAVRQNPHVKEQACHLAGHDIRVRDICIDYLPGSSRDRIRIR